MTEYRSVRDDEILQTGDVYEESDGTLTPINPLTIGCRASISMYNRWKRKIEPTPVVVSEVENGLKAIDNRLAEIHKILQEMTNLLNHMALPGNEREQIAFHLFAHNTEIGACTAFEQADGWIAERDRQRATERAER